MYGQQNGKMLLHLLLGGADIGYYLACRPIKVSFPAYLKDELTCQKCLIIARSITNNPDLTSTEAVKAVNLLKVRK